MSHHGRAQPGADGGSPGAAIDAAPAADCPAGTAGTDCLFDLYDRVSASCDPDLLGRLSAALTDRADAGTLPLWSHGRALLVSLDQPLAFAGAWNAWSTDADVTAPLCGSRLFAAVRDLPSGFYPYKVVDPGGAWHLDPLNWSFAYDAFAGNPDGRNSVLDTDDSGVGHLVQPPDALCSDALGRCGRLTTYLPPGYDSPDQADRRYPVVFLHDGQNVFDDSSCCFGFGGWDLNHTLDTEIAAGRAAPAVLVGFDNGGDQRTSEYGGALAGAFMDFQIGTVQARAAALWRLDPARVYTAGSSLGGLIAVRLALDHPEIYAGAASLSGSFFVGEDDGTSVRDQVEAGGIEPVAIYLDHGGTADGGGDNYQSNVDLADAMAAAGWQRLTSPDCGAAAPGRLCYYHDPGGTHDEVHWRARAWRFVRFLLAP